MNSISNITDANLLYSFESALATYYKYLRLDSVIMHILEEFGIYIDINESETYGFLANQCLDEIEKRGLFVSTQSFKYNPVITIDDITSQLINVKHMYIQNEQQNYIDKIIEYCKENEHKVLKENGLIIYKSRLDR